MSNVTAVRRLVPALLAATGIVLAGAGISGPRDGTPVLAAPCPGCIGPGSAAPADDPPEEYPIEPAPPPCPGCIEPVPHPDVGA